MPTHVVPLLAAATERFSFGEAHALALLFLGVALFAAIGALSHQKERALSAGHLPGPRARGRDPLAASGIPWLEPVENASLLEHATELAVIVALFATGLLLDRESRPRAWRSRCRSLYYVSAAIAAGILSGAESETLFRTVAAVVLVSIVAHGVTGAPVTRRLLVEGLPAVAAERGAAR